MRGGPRAGASRHGAVAAAKTLALAVALWMSVAATNAAAQPVATNESGYPQEQTEPNKPLEEVLVTGSWAGPKLWKISKGDHVLWLLGTPDVLPKNMTWDSTEVEQILVEAAAVISGRTSFSADAGLFGKLRLYMQWRGLQKQKAASLRETLPENLYDRFEALKNKYAPRDGRIEKLRPMFAAGRLYLAAIDASGLTGRDIVERRVRKLAAKHDLKVNRIELAIDQPQELLDEVDATPRETEIGCLAATVNRLESEIDSMTERARAWALGDVDTLRRLPYEDDVVSCWNAVTSAPRLKELRTRIQAEWLAAAESALTEHGTSLALHSISGLLGDGNLLDTFRARGYTVTGP